MLVIFNLYMTEVMRGLRLMGSGSYGDNSFILIRIGYIATPNLNLLLMLIISRKFLARLLIDGNYDMGKLPNFWLYIILPVVINIFVCYNGLTLYQWVPALTSLIFVVDINAIKYLQSKFIYRCLVALFIIIPIIVIHNIIFGYMAYHIITESNTFDLRIMLNFDR